MKRQIILNLFSNYAGRAVGVALGFFLIPFLIAKLGIEAFGLIVLFESFVRLFEMAGNALRLALARHATVALSQGRRQDFVEYLTTGRVLLLVISAVIIAAGLVLSAPMAGVLRIPEAQEEASRTLLTLMVVSLGVSVPNMVFWAGLYAQQRLDLIHWVGSCATIFRAAAIFILFSVAPASVSLVTYGVIYLAVTLAQNYLIYFAFRKTISSTTFNLRNFSPARLREIASFGMFSLAGHAGVALQENVLNVLVNLYWGPVGNALYGVGTKFADLMERSFHEPSWSLSPTFTDLVARSKNEKLKELLFIVTKGMTLVAVPILTVLFVYADVILHAWVGEDFGGAVMLMRLSLVPLFISIPFSSCESLPEAFAKMRVPSMVTGAACLTAVGLSWALSVPFGMGLGGFVLGGTIVWFFYYLLYTPTYACRISGIPIMSYWAEAFLKAALWAIATWGIAAIFLRLPVLTPVFALAVVLMAALYVWGGLRWVLSPQEKAHWDDLSKDWFRAFLRV